MHFWLYQYKELPKEKIPKSYIILGREIMAYPKIIEFLKNLKDKLARLDFKLDTFCQIS